MQQRWRPVCSGLALLACTSEPGPSVEDNAGSEATRDAGSVNALDAAVDVDPPPGDVTRDEPTEGSNAGGGIRGDDEVGEAASGGSGDDERDPESTDDDNSPGSDARPDAGGGAHDGEPDDLESDPADGRELPASCFEAPPGVNEFPQPEGPLEVQLGARDATTGIDWLPLGSNCGIPIGGIGQAGLTARLAVRVRSPDGTVARAKLRVTLVNYRDPERDPAPSNGPEVVQTLECRDDGWCYQVPLLVEISHLARLPELEGTLVTFDASAEQEDTGLTGTQQGWGMFVLDEGESQTTSSGSESDQ